MNITLVFPRFRYTPGDPPLGTSIVASHVRSKLDANVSVLDTTFNQSFEYAEKFLESKKPDIVGIYFDTMMYRDGIRVANIAKKLGSFVVAGGPHATILPDTLLDNVDMVVIGEGEHTFAEIIEKFSHGTTSSSISGTVLKENGEVIVNSPREKIKNLDDVAFPALDLLEMEKYMNNWHLLDSVNVKIRGTNVMASRGCPFNCAFCQPTLREMFGNIVRYRSPENVIEEIKIIKKNYNINGLFLHDDTLTANKKWITDFCSLLENENLNLLWGCNTRANTIDEDMMKMMKKTGMRVLHIGAESGSQRILDEVYHKGIKLEDVRRTVDTAKGLGIKTMCFFMIGAPTETKDEIEETIKFACSLNTNEITATITTPLPKTHLYNMMKDKYKISDNYSDFDYYSNRVFEDENLTFEMLKRLQKKLLFKFYTSPKRWPYIYRHMTSVKGCKKMISKIRRFS
jgi:anaerobic magnesium-protoporphyrin IX monomethyl ester cyclase